MKLSRIALLSVVGAFALAVSAHATVMTYWDPNLGSQTMNLGNIQTLLPNISATTLDGTTIGGTTPAPATINILHVDSGTKTAAATGGAATLNKSAGVITSESLNTAAGSTYTLTLTDSAIAAADQLMASVALGASTTGLPQIVSVKPGAGTATIIVKNIDATNPFNGTIKISFVNFSN